VSTTTSLDRKRKLGRERQRRFRARRKADRACFKIECDFYPLADRLVEAGLLSEWDMDNTAEVRDALERPASAIGWRQVTRSCPRSGFVGWAACDHGVRCQYERLYI
jgi:hypothetical protein